MAAGVDEPDLVVPHPRAAERAINEELALQFGSTGGLSIGIGIATDRNCQHIQTNRAFAQTLGLSPDTNASKTAPDQERRPTVAIATLSAARRGTGPSTR